MSQSAGGCSLLGAIGELNIHRLVLNLEEGAFCPQALVRILLVRLVDRLLLQVRQFMLGQLTQSFT